MKSYEEFKEFYSEELFSELLILDGIRKGILVKAAAAAIILIVLAGLASLLSLAGMIEPGIVFILCILCGGIWLSTVYFLTRDYRGGFKQMIIHPLIRFIDPNLQYAPDGFIDLYTFRRAEIFQRYVNEFDGEDLVSGTIGKTNIKFSEVKARYKDEDGEIGPDSIHPVIIALKILIRCIFNRNIFKGLFFVADFHKTFYGQVLIMPDKAEKYFGRFGKMLQSHNFLRGKLIRMDNTEFERQFAVYGGDQIQARYVLSPAVMDKILGFKKKTGDSIFLSFKNSTLYIAVPSKRNLFEPQYFRNMVDYIATFQYFQDLRLFIGIVDEFNLNTRIWSKE